MDWFLGRLRRIWPEEVCRFAEDLALKYLAKCQYSPRMALLLAERSMTCDLLDLLCRGTDSLGDSI